MLVKILPTDPVVPGEAQLFVKTRFSDALLENLEFSLVDNEQNYLQEGGQWSPAPHWFTICGGYPLENGSGFHIGAEIIDPVLSQSSQIRIFARLSIDDIRNTTLKVASEGVLPSSARGEVGEYGGSSVVVAPVAEPIAPPVVTPAAEPEVEPNRVVQPEPVVPPAPAAGSRSKLPLILGGIALLLLLAALAFWFLRGKADSSASEPASEPAAQVADGADAAKEAPASKEAGAPATVDGCSTDNLATKSELEFVQACIMQKPPTADLLVVIENAKSAKKCGVAQRLYANRAQGGDSKVALAYAREYDPKFHKANDCFKEADKPTAAYWYDTVLQFEPDNAEAKQRYEELSK
ncbi:MAG: hypothetical protein ACRC9M_06340 [Aeromonas sp.]